MQSLVNQSVLTTELSSNLLVESKVISPQLGKTLMKARAVSSGVSTDTRGRQCHQSVRICVGGRLFDPPGRPKSSLSDPARRPPHMSNTGEKNLPLRPTGGSHLKGFLKALHEWSGCIPCLGLSAYFLTLLRVRHIRPFAKASLCVAH